MKQKPKEKANKAIVNVVVKFEKKYAHYLFLVSC